jgi:hypothetical protein
VVEATSLHFEDATTHPSLIQLQTGRFMGFSLRLVACGESTSSP